MQKLSYEAVLRSEAGTPAEQEAACEQCGITNQPLQVRSYGCMDMSLCPSCTTEAEAAEAETSEEGSEAGTPAEAESLICLTSVLLFIFRD